MKKFNLNLDLTRLILSILIIANHTQPLTQAIPYVGYFISTILSRLGVPFFFVVSSYYLQKKIDYAPELQWTWIKHYLLNILKIYGLTILLYIPVWFFLNRNLDLVKLLWDILYFGIHYHLWYFPATVVGTLIVYPLKQLLNLKVVFVICLFLYFVGSIGNIYSVFFSQSTQDLFLKLGTTRNGLFFAPIFILIGSLLTRPFTVSFREFGIAAFGYWLETTLVFISGKSNPTNSMFLFLIPLVAILVSFLLKLPSKMTTSVFFHKLSMMIYICHPIFIILVTGIYSFLKLDQSKTVTFILVTGLSIVASFGYYQLKPIALKQFKQFEQKLNQDH